ncbi:hypothetical protein FACS1894130_04860 [Spirochaetia bacterium]|nr:hypothetical protein FACS1894130_04860 [Spirochaetia bacterium]
MIDDKVLDHNTILMYSSFMDLDEKIGLPLGQMELFRDGEVPAYRLPWREGALPETGVLGQVAAALLKISPDAYESFLLGWMSELPIERELLQFARKVISAESNGKTAAAERAASDRGDPAVRTVLEAAYKVSHEIDRMRGFLRFSPDERGVYAARCAPDHFVLPALTGHFVPRFGETPWAIIDKRRHLVLARLLGREPELMTEGGFITESPFQAQRQPISRGAASNAAPDDPSWENLWRTYHRSITNESRGNPGLQRQFMPVRYWKYLTELQGK